MPREVYDALAAEGPANDVEMEATDDVPRPSTSPVWVTQRRRCYVQLPRLDLETWVILRHPTSRRIFLGAATS